MKNILIIIICFFTINSCKKNDKNYFSSQKQSIDSVLKKFPKIDKNLEKVREVNLDSLSISLFKNNGKQDYDEILVFRKNKKYYAIPFFSNMYFDYWEFKDEQQKQLYAKTKSTFETELKSTIKNLNLSSKEFYLLFSELMSSILHAETNLSTKPNIFKNFVYMTYRVDKYKIDDFEYCKKRNNKIFSKILNDSKKIIRYNEYFLDSENG